MLSLFFELSRAYALPISFFCWLIAFIFGYFSNGNLSFGILALFGIILAHLSANMFDDYFDYKKLIKTGFQNAQNEKCRLILNNKISLKKFLILAFILMIVAGLIGIFLILKTGLPTLIFTLIGLIAMLFYAKFTYIGLGEFTILLIFGPTILGGVYYVMTNSFSSELFFISILVALSSFILSHSDATLDFKFDLKENKKTICYFLKSYKKSVFIIILTISLIYFLTILMTIFGIISKYYLILLINLLLAIKHCKNMYLQKGDFMQNFVTARNLATSFYILIC